MTKNVDWWEVGTVNAYWYPPTTPTPKGMPIWASDGKRVWLIHGDGQPIAKVAVSVKCWTAAYIPNPPVELP